MRGTVLYGPRDVRFEECPEPKIIEPTDAVSDLGHVRVRIGPVALPGRASDQGADADGARILRHCRRGRQRGEVDQAGPIRDRLVRHIGQHLPPLPIRVPVIMRQS